MSEHQDPFDPKTPNDPMLVGGRRMMDSTFQDNVTVGTKFLRSNMGKSFFHQTNLAGSTFDDINLSGCSFKNVNLSGCSFHDINFSRTIITHARFEDCEIPHGCIEGLKIAGIKVGDLLDAYKKVHGELPDPGHHDRE